MKYIDKFLKFLKTDRNTFLTYVLTLATLYILVDRITELLFLFFTGISVSYWGPIIYTIAMACPVFAFVFSGRSKFVKSDNLKLIFVYTYVTTIYILAISMVCQWVNELLWILFMSVPNYVDIVTSSSELIKPAFTAIALYLPITTACEVFKFIYLKVNDTKDLKDSIIDYKGIDLSPAPNSVGPYTCENILCVDKVTGKPVVIPETVRFESTLIVGGSGSGKTSMIFEPMITRDLEKKFFFKEVSKEMGFTALKTGIATLVAPYNNDYLNANFNLNMLRPVEAKFKVYKTYMKKLIMNASSPDNITYKSIGITAMSPDYESTSHMMQIADNFSVPYNIIDPNNPDSVGINPFVFDDPSKTAIAISSVLKGMYNTTHTDVEEAFRENVTAQAIENLSILLKEMYPRLNDGDLPTLEDVLQMLTEFDLVEDMCRKMEFDEELSQKYRLQISYFKKNFYKNGSGRPDTEKFVYSAITQLDNLLRIEGVRHILCNRTNNIDFDKALQEGQVTFVCTRRGDLGASSHKAFGLFFIMLMQYSILRRPGNEKNRIPHYMYIDEFPDFICKATDSIFTLYRKYRVGTIISAQNLEQLGNKNYSKFRQTILSNTTTKLLFGGATVEDCEWWSKEFGNYRRWKFKRDYETSQHEYTSKYAQIEWGWTEYFKPDKLKNLGFKSCAYRTKNIKGAPSVGQGKVNFLDSKYKEVQAVKTYNFSKFTSGITEETPKESKKRRFDYSNIDFSDSERENEIDPIKIDNSDSSFLFNNEDAIIVDFKKDHN